MITRSGKIVLLTAVLSAFYFATQAGADVLFDNSNINTGVGNGFNGANTSAIAANSTTFGYSANGAAATISLGEDFTLGSSSLITGVTVFAYSTSTYPFPPVSPFTGITVNIWNAQPGSAGAAVLFTSSTLSMTAWTGTYRVQSTTLTNAQRPVFSLTAGFSNVSLLAGNYWISYTITGISSPGVSTSIFSPPLMNADGTQPAGNAIQSTNGGSTWAQTADATTGITNRLPLIVNGTVVPEPSSIALLVVGGIGAIATAVRRRSRPR